MEGAAARKTLGYKEAFWLATMGGACALGLQVCLLDDGGAVSDVQQAPPHRRGAVWAEWCRQLGHHPTVSHVPIIREDFYIWFSLKFFIAGHCGQLPGRQGV